MFLSIITFLPCLLSLATGNNPFGIDPEPEVQQYYLLDNCKDLPDGAYYMKLLEDDTDTGVSYPIVKVKCESSYMIIDVNYDSNLMQYFTSWAMWHSSIAGPTNTDIVDWTSWFMKSREDPDNSKFLISPDCNSCEEDSNRQHFNTKSTYWMSGNLFGCYWMFLGKHNCDLDKDTYTCYDCSQSSDPEANGDAIEITEDSDPGAYYYTGQCATAVRSSDSEVTSSHDTCQLGLHWRFGDEEGDNYEDDYNTNVVTTEHSTGSDALENFETATNSMKSVSNNKNKNNGDGVEKSLDFADGSRRSLLWDNDQFAAEIFKPSLGTDGRFCVCEQNNEANYYAVPVEQLKEAMKKFGDELNTFHQFVTTDTKKIKSHEMDVKPIGEEEMILKSNVNNHQDEEVVKTSENNRVELRSHNFERGTYRIKEAGTYVIMEDIEFNFNAGSTEDPQAVGAWKPWLSQMEQYPGAESGRDEYFLGFFAGITIECDDVVLDLNGHTIGMSEVFYHQQRWFTTISLTSQFFLPGNGPGFFGYDPQSASNVIIKNGIIGLSSHFGIHGNYNADVLIQDVQIRDFEVHGIQFNGFERLTMKNVEVGPSSKIAYMTGEYGHMRYVLDRLNKAIDELGDDADDAIMNFYGRDPISLKDIASQCERMMNYAFDYVVKETRLTEEDFTSTDDYNEYLDAIDIFVNPSGIPYASVLHGIFLNTKEASVMTYNLYTTTYSETATLENIKIHDLQHAMDERVRMYNDIYMFFGPFLNCLNARQLVGDDAVNEGKRGEWGSTEMSYTYAGSIVTDVYLALTKYSNNWDYLEKMLTGAHTLVPWAEGEADLPSGTQIACNMDVMIHSGKGTTGLRLDGVKDISVKGLEIYNLHDSTPLGERVCGKYSNFNIVTGGGHLAQQAPMQVGFSGNRVQAVTFNSAFDIDIIDVNIYNLESESGPVTGLTIWPANDITFSGNIKFSNFEPSSKYNENDKGYGELPNRDHYSCAIYVYETYYKSTTYTTDINFEYDSINGCNINPDDWENDCYVYGNAFGEEFNDLDKDRDLYEFLSKANNVNSECSDDNIIIMNRENDNVDAFKEDDVVRNGNNVIVYSGIVLGVVVVIGVIIIGIMYWRRNNGKINYSPLSNDYGTL